MVPFTNNFCYNWSFWGIVINYKQVSSIFIPRCILYFLDTSMYIKSNFFNFIWKLHLNYSFFSLYNNQLVILNLLFLWGNSYRNRVNSQCNCLFCICKFIAHEHVKKIATISMSCTKAAIKRCKIVVTKIQATCY